MPFVIKLQNRGICFSIFYYWFILMLWQHIAGASNRGIVDTIVKLALLFYLIRSFLKIPALFNGSKMLILIIFAITQVFTFILTDLSAFTPSVIIAYAFPSVYIFLSMVYGNKFTVEEEDIDTINKYIRIVAVFSVFYTIIFEPSEYINALTASHAYGNELNSFFISMYEYALYLFYSITTCLKEINKCEMNHSGKKTKYYLMIIIFFITLVMTFCRTAIIGCLVYFLVYALLYPHSKLSNRIKLFLIIGVALVLFVTPLRRYVLDVGWKGGQSHSRERLTAYAIEYYKNSDVVQKLFGHGITRTRSLFTVEQIYGSVHNGYLQALLYYGVIGLTFLISFLIAQMVKIIKFIKVDRNMGAMGIAYLLFCIITMIPSTLIVFYSSIDCFFLTTMLIILPMYERNRVLREKTLKQKQ